MRAVTVGLIVMLLTLNGCSKDAPGDTPKSADADTPASADAPPARDDACALLTLAEVRRVLPDAAEARRNDRLVSQGINGCGWHVASDKNSVIDVNVWQVSGADDTPMEHARTLAMGFADPLSSEAQAAVRLETIAGVGEEAVAIVERTDSARGILTTGAMLALRQNGRIATVASSRIAAEDRSAALEKLATLGKAVAARL